MANLLFEEEWFRPISAKDLIIGSLDMLLSLRLSCWCRCLTRRASLTCIPNSFLVKTCASTFHKPEREREREIESGHEPPSIPFLSPRSVRSPCWSCYRVPNRRFVPNSPPPCPTSQFHLTAGSSARRERAARASLREVCSTYFHPPPRLPRT